MSAQVPPPPDRPARRPRMPIGDGSDAGKEQQQQQQSFSMTTIIGWNTEQLVQLESALQLCFAQPRVVGLLRRTVCGSNNNESLLPLDDFYGLTRKLSLRPIDTGAAANKQYGDIDKQKEEKLRDLNEMESLLFQLLCVSSPILYRLTSTDDGGGGEGEDTNRCCWCLERITTTSDNNRISQLHKLIQERDAKTSQTNAQAQIFLQAIREHRKLREARQPKVSTACTTTTSTFATTPAAKDIEVTDSTIMQPAMTVEERVRARANAKRKFQEEEEKSASTGSSNANDRSWLVRLADALWTHASSILQRQARFQSPRRNLSTTTSTITRKTAAAAAPSHCSLTLKDVISFLRQSMPLNKRKIAQGIQELHRIVPEWIVLSDATSLSPDTTVWLNPAEYKTIRFRLLTGEEPPQPPKKKALLNVNHDKKDSLAVTLQTKKQMPPLASTNYTATKAAAAAASSGPLNHIVTRIQQGPIPTPTTHRRRCRAPAVSMSPAASYPTKLSGTKRASEHTTTTTTTSSTPPSTPVTKKRKGLRVNPNLILTDTDYEGGEVIRPTSFDSPRGLKSLFDQMKAGRRI